MIILRIICLLLAVLVFRAAAFRAKDTADRTVEPVQVNGERARENLATLVRFATVSDADYEKTDKAVFAAYNKILNRRETCVSF